MGFVLILLAVAALITALVGAFSGKGDKVAGVVVSTVICSLVLGVIMAFILGVSYYNYIGLKQRLVTIEQYRTSIQMYSDRGILDFKKHEKGSYARISDLTDFKYQNYQVQMAKMVDNLKTVTVAYNNNLISKRVLKASWLWSWCVIGPDPDMKPLQMAGSQRVEFTTGE